MAERFHPDRLRRVLSQVEELIRRAIAAGVARAEDIARVPAEYRPSADNLAHYLAVRRHDLRPLQRELADLALSSRGLMEGRVLDTLHGVRLALLGLLEERSAVDATRSDVLPGVSASRRLKDNAVRLLGPKEGPRQTRIMVTLPTEAMGDRTQLRELMIAGMDLVRINLAHDAPATWTAMVDNLRAAEAESMRNAIKDPIVARGKTLYIYPQLYEGLESTKYLYCTGPTPAQQCDTFIPWLIKNGGKKFALPSANYVWPHTLNVYARKVIEANGGEVVFEEYYPLDQVDFSATVNRIISNKVDVVFNTVIPRGVGPFFKQLYEAGFLKNGGRLACVYYDENTLNINQASEIEGLASCLDYFKVLTKEDPFNAKIQAAYEKDFPGNFLFAAGSAATGTYRGLKLWEAAAKEAGKVDRDSVAAALDHAKIAEGPGGPAEMVPGKRHCKLKMYTAVAKGGNYEIVARSAGLVDPKEC